ncbi:MAG: anthrax toxin-like adenylyl cyclase domain-containing protein [Plesiomonas sp.]
MKKIAFKRSTFFLTALPILSFFSNLSYGAVSVNYTAKNVYDLQRNNYSCQVSITADASGTLKGGSLVNIEVMRYNEELELPYISKELFFGVLKENNGHLSLTRDAMISGDNDQNAKCIVTNVALPGSVRSPLTNQSHDLQSGTAIYEKVEDKNGPISNITTLVDLLSVPFIHAMQEDMNPEFVELLPLTLGEEDNRLKKTSNIENYAIFVKEVMSGKTGIIGAYNNGLSRNFLEEKTADKIEIFLIHSLILPAIKHGLAAENIDKNQLAKLLRLHILADLEQDSYFEYGSEENIQASLAFQYSSTITTSMQLLSNAEFFNKSLIKEWKNIEEKYDEMSEAALDIGFPLIYSQKDMKGNALSVRTLKEQDIYVAHSLPTNFSDFYDNPYEPISASIPAGWSIFISDNFSMMPGSKRKLIEGPFKGNLPLFLNSDFSLKPLSLLAQPPILFKPVNSSLEHELNIHPTDAYMHMQLTMHYPNLDGIDLAQAVFSNNNPSVSIDIENGTINNSSVNGGFLGKNFVQMAATIYQKEIDDLEDWEMLSVKASLEAVGIDTTYSYGSPNNIKSSLLHRLSLQLTENALDEYIGSGLEPALFDDLQESGLTQLDARKAFRDLVYSTLTNSNLNLKFASNMNEEQKKDAVIKSLLSWHDTFQDLQTSLMAIDYDSTAKEHIFNYPLTDELYAKSRLYEYGAVPTLVEELWKPYLIHGRLDLLPGYGYNIPSWLIQKDKKALGSITNTAQQEWHKNHRVLAQKLGAFLGAMIDSKAKLEGRSEFTLSNKTHSDARLHHGIKLYKVQQTVGGSGLATLVSDEIANKYVLTSTNLGYTVLLPNSIIGMLNTDGFSFRSSEIDYHNLKDSSPVFIEMNANVAKECVWENMNATLYAYNYCKSKYTQSSLSQNTDEELLASLITKHIIDNRDQLKSTTTAADYVKGILQSIVPVWATVEDFQKGNYGMASIGLISDVGFFLPIGKAAFTSVKLTGKITSKLLPKRFKIKKVFNKIEIGNNNRIVGEAFDIDIKVAKKNAREAWLKVPKVIFDQMNILPVTDIVKGAKSATLRIKQRVSKIKNKNTDPYAPKVYQSRDFKISSNDRPSFDPDKVVGIPSNDRKVFANLANEENLVIGIRFVDPNNRSLLESGLYSSKSLLIKSKSSDWGPHAGFIPVNQKYAKTSARNDVDRFNLYSNNAIDSGAAKSVQLTIDEKRLRELQAGDNPLIPELTFDLDNQMYYGDSNGVTFYYKKESDNLWSIWVKETGHSDPVPLQVMGDATSSKPMTADYDLFSVMTHISDYGSSDMMKMPIPYKKWKESITDPDNLPPKIKELYNNEELYNKVHNMHLGIISDRVISLKDKINNRLGRGNGMELVHHGADDANPGAVINDNFPATYFVPDRYLNYDGFGPGKGSLKDFFQVDNEGAIILLNVDDFANFHQLMTNVHFTGPLNTRWSENYAQLARKNRLSHAYLDARDQVEALLDKNINVAKINTFNQKPFDENLPKGRIPAKNISQYRITDEIIDVRPHVNGMYTATVKTNIGPWIPRMIRVVRIGYYYYHVDKIEKEFYLTTQSKGQKLRIEQDQEGFWIAPDLPIEQ